MPVWLIHTLILIIGVVIGFLFSAMMAASGRASEMERQIWEAKERKEKAQDKNEY